MKLYVKYQNFYGTAVFLLKIFSSIFPLYHVRIILDAEFFNVLQSASIELCFYLLQLCFIFS